MRASGAPGDWRLDLVPSGRELRTGGDARIRGKEQPAGSGAPLSVAAPFRPTEQRAAQCGGSRRLLLPPERSGLDLRSRCSSISGASLTGVTAAAAAAVAERTGSSGH
jgi:hypothetical protein